jgi:hypothetical protein
LISSAFKGELTPLCVRNLAVRNQSFVFKGEKEKQEKREAKKRGIYGAVFDAEDRSLGASRNRNSMILRDLRYIQAIKKANSLS